MSYDPSVCDQDLNDMGLTPICEEVDADEFHCSAIMETDPYHKMCAGRDIYFPVPVTTACYNSNTNQWKYFPASSFFQQCGDLHTHDPGWNPSMCFCCCSCFANDTLITVPDGVKAIVDIAVGDVVLAGAPAAGGGVTWVNEPVAFSQGTGPGGHQPSMVYLALDDGTDLICSADQPFLTPEGTFVVGEKIAPGDHLVKQDGTPTAVQLASIGSYSGGVHHIATKVPWTGDAAGHLIVAGGVVAGDYLLQLYLGDLPAGSTVPDHDDRPSIGTPAYEESCGAAAHDVLVEFNVAGADDASSGTLVRKFAQGTFRTYVRSADAVPYGAQALLTADQAADVLAHGTFAPLSNPIGKGYFQIIAAQFAGFYPDVDFYYEHLAMEPQVYAFEAYGRKVVQVNGGLTRLKGFLYEGLAMAMAHGIGCFDGGPPLNAAGHPAVGQADTYAFGVAGRNIWTGAPFLTNVMAAIGQWNGLFGLVSPDHAGGTPDDRLDDPGLRCRFENIQTAAAGGALAPCAGGTPLPALVLEKVTPGSGGLVELTFNAGTDPTSGADAANYSLDGGATVGKATVNPRTNFSVTLETDAEPGTTYALTVRNLVSYLGGDLAPDPTTASFTTPA